MLKYALLLNAVSAFTYKKVVADIDDVHLKVHFKVSLTEEFPDGGEFWLQFPKVNGESMVNNADITDITEV